MDQNHNDLTFSSCEWAPGRLGSSPSHWGPSLDSPPILKYSAHPAYCFQSSSKKHLPVVKPEHEYEVPSFPQTSLPSSLLSPLSLSPGFDSDDLNCTLHQDGLQIGFERSCISEPPSNYHIIEEEVLGLGLHSCPFPDYHSSDELPPPRGISQRTTWLSLPGADTDDDLIPAELGSKTYIPDPFIAIPTTPPSRSLLIWDSTTPDGLPAGLPSFDGTSHTPHQLDVDALPICGPCSPDEDFDVDPAFLAKLAEKDVEKSVEVHKLCELKQRANIAAVAAGNGREGARLDVERVREKWREITALLRLKLASDSGGSEDGGSSPASSFLSSSLSTSVSSPPTSPSTSEAPDLSSNPCSPASSPSTSPQIIQRRTSKPKITSMAQLVANMVFHRQQDALRRSPTRSRTWSPAASTAHTTGTGKTRSRTQTSPTSPLRQMILPEDLDDMSGNDGHVEYHAKDSSVLDSPLQLSPLCLAFNGSPESFYAQLDATPSVPLSAP